MNATPDRTVPDQAALERTPNAPALADRVPANEPVGAAPLPGVETRTVLPVRPQQNTRKQQAQTIRRAPVIADSERAMSKLSPKAREYLYSQTFRRCPAPGSAGALQCRKHICNGAEGGSPACFHINRLKL
jgi:hypothetical protein